MARSRIPHASQHQRLAHTAGLGDFQEALVQGDPFCGTGNQLFNVVSSDGKIDGILLEAIEVCRNTPLLSQPASVDFSQGFSG